MQTEIRKVSHDLSTQNKRSHKMGAGGVSYHERTSPYLALGVPTATQLVSQARLRWLGHLARMDNGRLPKQMLFAFFPGNVGTPTQPGRRTGKYLAFDIVNDLEKAGVKVCGWMTKARRNEGAEWRQVVFRAAPWFRPKQPKFGHPPPARDIEGCRPNKARSKKQAFQTSVVAAQTAFSQFEGESGFLRCEARLGGRENLICALREALKSELGEAWNRLPAQEAAEAVIHLPDWDDCLNLSVDLGLLVMSIDAAMKDQGEWPAQPPCVGLTHKKPGVTRHRLYFKQARPACYLPSQEVPTHGFSSGVKVTLNRGVRRLRQHEHGDFVCSICGRKYPTKRGLAGHVELTHTEGTFREAGFQCELCPRIFDRLSARTLHYTRDHVLGSRALSCPYCKAVFPGHPMMRLHIAESHQNETGFPMPCPLCVNAGAENPPNMVSAIAFKRHRAATHLRDVPIAVFES